MPEETAEEISKGEKANKYLHPTDRFPRSGSESPCNSVTPSRPGFNRKNLHFLIRGGFLMAHQ